jgi:ADP-ribosyl-[dinitrogen reductase] hydrolase
MAEKKLDRERILGGMWGAVVGDALGVPVEFTSRAVRKRDPVIDMRGYGTHHQPPGTWSDDSSLLLCTVDSLVHHEFDLHDMGQRFVRWYREGYWTPWGKVFDIGGTTRRAIGRLEKGVDPELAGDADEASNGNGSLMRILPIALRFASSDRGHSSRPGASGGVSPQSLPPDQLIDRAHRVSGLTHRHPRSQIACGFYCLIVAELLRGATPLEAYGTAVDTGLKTYAAPPYLHEMGLFLKFVSGRIHELPESDIGSSGYVIDTLEACVWCLLTSSSYEEAVLKAVNLGDDTDTTGCVTGGLAGVCYGAAAVRTDWIRSLAKEKDLREIFGDFTTHIPGYD